MTLPTALQRQLMKAAAADVVVGFYHAIDRDDREACLARFAEDAAWTRQGTTHQGLAAIERALHERPAALMVRHVLTNVYAELEGEDRAGVSAYVAVHAHKFEDGIVKPPAPVKPPIGLYAVTAALIWRDDAWKITALSLTPQFYTSQMSPRPNVAQPSLAGRGE